MKILPLTNGAVNNSNFKSCYRSYHPSAISKFNNFSNQRIKTSTNFFREDLDWNNFIEYLLSQFKDKDRVNLYSMACSDGSEAYSLAISFMEKIPKRLYEKFFPIKAHDIDNIIIDAAKSGRINIEDCEIYYINKSGIDLNKYFVNRKPPIKIFDDTRADTTMGIYSYEAVPELRQSVEFKKSDILTELMGIKDDGNSVVMCRNVMPYFKDDYIDKIVKTASQVLKDGSLFVMGDYDSLKNFEERLLENGFYMPLLNSRNLYRKGNPKELTDKLYSGYLI